MALHSWNTDVNPGIKYFSGTATYRSEFTAPATWFFNHKQLEVDLGAVKCIAEVLVNGMSAGVLWQAPFRTDITRLLKRGANQITVKVTNLWPNRLIGDKQPDAAPVVFAPFNPYAADSPLLDSGLLGPVTLNGVNR